MSYSADKGTVGEANQLMLGAGFRDAHQYRWVMIACKDAYHNVISGPRITFTQGYLAIKNLCYRLNITANQFWLLFKKFTGDGPFTNRGKPWMIGILFYIATHGKAD